MGVELGLKELLERVSREQCLLCAGARVVGPLCHACAPEATPGAFAAQIRSGPPKMIEGTRHAALFDAFGQAHLLGLEPATGRPAIIGRDAGCPLSIVDRSVSRSHAALIYRCEDEEWYMQDLGSRNGTSIEGVAVASAPRRVTAGDRVGIANFEFRFLSTAALDVEQVDELMRACRQAQRTTVSQFQLRAIAFAPTDDAGGFVTVERQTPTGRQHTPISLTELDFELLHLLASRYVEMSNFEDQARGWISSSEILGEGLPFGTPTPTSNNLRGAIKRIRDKFRKGGVEGVIQSRQNVGYRLMPGFDTISL